MGIVGIERKLEEKRKETDKNISEVSKRNRLTGSPKELRDTSLR